MKNKETKHHSSSNIDWNAPALMAAERLRDYLQTQIVQTPKRLRGVIRDIDDKPLFKRTIFYKLQKYATDFLSGEKRSFSAWTIGSIGNPKNFWSVTSAATRSKFSTGTTDKN